MTAHGSRSRSAPSSSRSSMVVLVVFQYTEGEEVKISFASTLSSIRAICPNRVICRAWIISVSRGWLVWHRTSSLEMKWYHLMLTSIWRHHWWRALILHWSFLGNRPALWPIQETRQYTGVVEPQLSWQRDSQLPELLVKALHCCTRECTSSHDVWKAVIWRVVESPQVDKFLHCANPLLQHYDGRGTSWMLPKACIIVFCQLTSNPKESASVARASSTSTIPLLAGLNVEQLRW